MTPPNGLDMKEPEVNWRNFRVVAELVRPAGIDTAMITSLVYLCNTARNHASRL